MMITAKKEATIDYDKYANMDTRQLANALMNAEKREQKFRAKSQMKLKNMRKLIRFLKSKIKESVDRAQFVPYKKADCQNLQEKLKNNSRPKS